MELHVVPLVNPEPVNVIVGQAHFVKTVEDLYEGYPVNVLNVVKQVLEVWVFCATANPVEVVAETDWAEGSRVVDGEPPLGVETDADAQDRHDLLRRIGYKL